MILKGIAIAVLCSFFSFLIHLLASFMRQGRRKNESVVLELQRQTKLLLVIWSLGFLIYIGLFLVPASRLDIFVNNFSIVMPAAGFIYGVIFYFLLSFIYLTFYYLADRSVSATLLEIIESSPDKKLTLAEVKKIYNIEKKYANALKGMSEGGFVIQEGDYYRNSFKATLYSRIADFIKCLLKLGPGG